MRRLCTICARGGSKGVPNKNLRPLLGKPLLAHSIERARESGLFERIAVSSDSAAILDAAKAAGADDMVERPPEMATDTASKLPAIVHALTTVESRHGVTYDTLVDLDATSPLRLAADIRGAIALFEESGATSVITGTPSHRSPYFNLVEEGPGGFVNVSKPPADTISRRQDAPRTFDMDASIYVWNPAKFRADPKVFYPDTRLFEMPAERSHDIDSELDFEFVELLLRRRLGIAGARNKRFDLGGKIAVVTGGAGILGQHFVRALAQHGASVAIIDLDAAALDIQAKATSQETSSRIIGIGCDITQPDAIKKAIDRIEAELGPIDILHNNAASKGSDLKAFFAPVGEYDLATWREVMAVNLDAMFLVAQEVGKRMVARGKGGAIIQTSSIYGIVAPDPRIYEGSNYLGQAINTPPIYAASKAGVVGLSKYLAALWGPANVRVNTLVPGGVESGQNDTFTQRYGARVPLGRMAQAEEMVGALIYLASDASSYVTGQTLAVDGGLSAW
jgi:CMP-N-acetylneuraminic acid synthetase/NAD(P)-dependent dehydrogenase (short-subunit alcohol dehydrogenase family)